jgi:hypothetical protein
MRIRKLQPLRSLGVILSSAEMDEFVGGIAGRIARRVSDPDGDFTASVQHRTFRTRSARGVDRVVGQVGAAPWAAAIEAKRGPLARALRETDG